MKLLSLNRLWLAAAAGILLLVSVYLMRGALLPDPEAEWVAADDEIRRLLDVSEKSGNFNDGRAASTDKAPLSKEAAASPKAQKAHAEQDSSKGAPTESIPIEGPSIPANADKIEKQTKAPASDLSSRNDAVSSPVKSEGKLNLNTATAEQLDGLPGIGPSRAEAILELRRQLGGAFRSVDQLEQVKGIGGQTMIKLWPLVTVESQ